MESGGGAFDALHFHFGNDGSNDAAWSESGPAAMTPFVSARITLRLEGDQLTVEIDRRLPP